MRETGRDEIFGFKQRNVLTVPDLLAEVVKQPYITLYPWQEVIMVKY